VYKDKKKISVAKWHPEFKNMFVSANESGCIKYWTLNFIEEQAKIIDAHYSNVQDLAWHPLGHVLISVSEKDRTKLWGRNEPGDIINN